MPGPGRRPVRIAGDAERAAAGLGDHVEGEVLLVRAAFAEALHLGVDDAGVQFAHDVVAEAQPLDRAGREVLDAHVGLAQHVLDQRQPLRRLQVDRDRALVGVEDVEIIRVGVRLAGPQPAARIAHLRVLDLHHVGAEPGERLGAGRPGLELRQIDDLHAGRGTGRWRRHRSWRFLQEFPLWLGGSVPYAGRAGQSPRLADLCRGELHPERPVGPRLAARRSDLTAAKPMLVCPLHDRDLRSADRQIPYQRLPDSDLSGPGSRGRAYLACRLGMKHRRQRRLD